MGYLSGPTHGSLGQGDGVSSSRWLVAQFATFYSAARPLVLSAPPGQHSGLGKPLLIGRGQRWPSYDAERWRKAISG